MKNPTQEQVERRKELKTKAGGKLVGPAREFMYRWELAANGLVSEAFVQPDKLVDGIEALATLNPRLVLDISAFKNTKVAQAVGALSLAAFETVSLPAMNDKQLATVAPALKGVRKIYFMCRGFADANFTPAGLRAAADQLEKPQALKIDFYRSENEPNDPPRPCCRPSLSTPTSSHRTRPLRRSRRSTFAAPAPNRFGR